MTIALEAESFAHVPGVKAGGVLLLEERFHADPSPEKISLNAGAYRDAQGRPFLLSSVKQAVDKLISSPTYSHEYLGLQGHQAFLRGSRRIAFGAEVDHDRLASLQTIGGTGACHMGAAFLKKWYRPGAIAYVSDPSWENHHDVFRHEGIETRTYPYWNETIRDLRVQEMLEVIGAAPEGSIIVLHACGHNPTGLDLSLAQQKDLVEVMLQRGHFAFFDSAYQGFVSGDLEQDNQAVKLFTSMDVPMLVAQSFSKNAGLYGERLGVLHVRCEDAATSANVVDQLKYIARREISSPGRYAAEIMAHIFEDETLLAAWNVDLRTMADRLTEMRAELARQLEELSVPGDWSHIVRQRGMFAYTGLTPSQCQMMTDDLRIYFPPSGRISIAGLNHGNVGRVAQGIAYAVGRSPVASWSGVTSGL